MENIPADRLRIIDANINRLGEGLRVLEEFARLTLNDAILTQRLKDLRHKLVNINGDLQKQLLRARDAAGDVGSEMDVSGEEKKRDIPATIIANARRVQESLRVMEEMAKIPGLALDSEGYRQARFDIYSMEKALLSGVLRKEKVKKLAGLYGVVDTAWLKGRSHIEITTQLIRGGAKIIQLRCKEGNTRDFLSIASDLKGTCPARDVLFIVNDSLEVALAVGADGLHIGQEDLPAAIARKLMPIDMILGVSVSNVAEAKKALADGADYLGLGAIFATATKQSARAVGLEMIKKVKHTVALPVVAIGGINKDNLKSVIEAGADAAAVISAILQAKDIEQATMQLTNIFREQKRG